MPEGQHDTSTFPKDAGKQCQATSVSTKKCCKSREPLSSLHVNSNTNIGEHTSQEINGKTHSVSGEQHSDDCCTRQQQNDTKCGQIAEKVAQKRHNTSLNKNAEESKNVSDCNNTVPLLDSRSLPVVKDGSLSSNPDLHVCDQADEEPGLTSHVCEQKGKDPGLSSRHNCDQEDKESQDDDCLLDSSNIQSQASFLIGVNKSAKSSSVEEYTFLHLKYNPTNEYVSDPSESASPVRSDTNAICDRNKCPITTTNEINNWLTKCEGIATRESSTQLPTHSKPCPALQERSVRADSNPSTRTTIEVNTHSVNSGRKFSDFSISFLLSQDGPSMRGTIRCKQTRQRRGEGHCENSRRGCMFEVPCGNMLTTCSCGNTSAGITANTSTFSCGACSCNQEITNCRHEDNCPSRQNANCAARCCDKHKCGCPFPVGHFGNKCCMPKSHCETFSLPTISSSSHHSDPTLNSSLTDSPGNVSGNFLKSESAGEEMLDDSDKRCSTPIRRHLKRPWTADDSNQLQSEHETSLDSPMPAATSKMARFKYTEDQILYLKDVFIKNRYPSYDELVTMSEDTGVPVRQLQVWFQNKRASTTGTRRPKIKRTEDYLEYGSLTKPSTAEMLVARPTLPPCTNNKEQALPNGPTIQGSSHQHFLPRKFTDYLGLPQDLAANTFTHGPSPIAHTQPRSMLPLEFPSHVYPGTAMDAASLQAYLTPVYSHSAGLGLRYPDITSLHLFNSYMAHSGALAMPPAPSASNSHLLALLGHPGVQRAPSVNSPRELIPADVFMSPLLPQSSNQRDKRKLP